MLHATLLAAVKAAARQFKNIPAERKAVLQQIVDWIAQKTKAGKPANLLFICSHNARRSFMAEAWATAAAYYYDVEGAKAFSGGVAATALHPNTAAALQGAGFQVTATAEGDNPVYALSLADDAPEKSLFSKLYDDEGNPKKHFIAVLVCSEADNDCPVIEPAERRILLPYNDPKEADGTAEAAARYAARSQEIATEMLYIFSHLR